MDVGVRVGVRVCELQSSYRRMPFALIGLVTRAGASSGSGWNSGIGRQRVDPV